MYLLARIEETAFSTWIRESGWGFFTSLTLHSLALALVVGINLATNFRLLGFAKGIPIQLMGRFLPLMWFALVVVVLSGTALLIAYPAKALTNILFYLKISAIIAALMITRHFSRTLFNEAVTGEVAVDCRVKTLAAIALILWISSIGAGRFLAYTNSILLASSFY